MPKNCVLLANTLARRFVTIERTRVKVETLLIRKEVSRRDIETIYSGLFTNAVTAFEAFLEELFFGLLLGNLRHRYARSRVPFQSRDVARDCVLNGRPFVDWLPYGKTKERARIYFCKGRPFTSMSDQLEQQIMKVSILRNAVVHSSGYARSQFESTVLGSTPLAPRERTPIGYLRSQARLHPPEYRFQMFLKELIDAAMFLCTKH
ncbi:MAG: hypothetical protein HY283_02430 [Nitrospirae bacterium]|nr:hypothetical protein [Nitrospirota bacterium]